VRRSERPQPAWLQALLLLCAAGLFWVAWVALTATPMRPPDASSIAQEGP
jgi:hypothetical protein